MSPWSYGRSMSSFRSLDSGVRRNDGQDPLFTRHFGPDFHRDKLQPESRLLTLTLTLALTLLFSN